jgi:N-acetylneuraminate synthase/sialic acid synthase
MIKIDINKHYLIAEIGNNHQGDINQAFELFRKAKSAGADAVKLQKRNNKSLYTKSYYNKKYENENSFGETYGSHREFLEFNETEYKQLKEYASELKIDFFATAFDFESIDFLNKIDLPAIKIASGDLLNTPLQIEISKLNKTVILSTGGGTLDDIKRATDNILKYNNDLIILHCTASYPAEISDINLNIITLLKKEFPKNVIGLSDHENGIDAAPLAYLLGARVFEKHFTLNRALKGTDHAFSLEPHGLEKLVRNLNRVPLLLGSNKKEILPSEKEPIYKMGKSIVAKKPIKKNEKITLDNTTFKSPADGLPPHKIYDIIGKASNVDLDVDDLINIKNLY